MWLESVTEEMMVGLRGTQPCRQREMTDNCRLARPPMCQEINLYTGWLYIFGNFLGLSDNFEGHILGQLTLQGDVKVRRVKHVARTTYCI